jgi:hypothetical protein
MAFIDKYSGQKVTRAAAVFLVQRVMRERNTNRYEACVFRSRTLTQVLADAESKYADWTPAMINDHRFSHGHCVASAY